jgi:zinc transporter ZupT
MKHKTRIMDSGSRKIQLLIIFILVLSGCATSESEQETSQTVRTAPLRTAEDIVIDGSGTEDSFLGEKKSENVRVSVSTVALFTLAMAAATGLGAVPFFFVELDSQWAGICNGMAAGVMLAASFDLIQEGQDHGSSNWVVFGILAGGIFIWLCKQFLEEYGEVSMLDIKGADARKVILVVGIMTLHSFGEGSGVGVSFAGSKGLSQGILITLAIAVHNIPEGLAVSMVLASRGVSPQNAMLWSIITSLPQPIVAIPSFICADAFNKFLPFCTGFAAGCMIWMVIAEVLPDAFKESSPSQVASSATLSVAFMAALGAIFQNVGYKYNSDDTSGLLISLLFGLGPLLGGIALITLTLIFDLQNTLLTGISTGIAFILGSWRPLQLLFSSKITFLPFTFLLITGSTLVQILQKLTNRKRTSTKNLQLNDTVNTFSLSPLTLQSILSCTTIAFHALVEGLALGVAAPKAYGLGQHMVLPVSLHGLPRGAAVASCIYGATGNQYGALVAAAIIGFTGPISAIGSILAGIEDYEGLDKLMVLACGGLFPCFLSLVLRAGRLDKKRSGFGVLIGVGFASVCLACTKLVCLHTPYCNSAPEAVR